MPRSPGPPPAGAATSDASPTRPRRRSAAGRRSAVATAAGLLLFGLAACNGATGAGSGATIAVQGTVVGLYGAPLANVQVLVGTTTTTTAADGSFTLPGVTTPYDVAVYLDPAVVSTSRPTVVVFQGLTLAHPTIGVLASSGVFSNDQVGGSVGRQLVQNSSVNENGVALPAGATFAEGGTTLDATNTPGFGPFPTGWGGSADRPTTLFVLTADVDTTTNLPTTYTGYAAVPLTLQNGVDQTGLTVPLSATGLSTVQVQGSVTVPSGYTTANATNCVYNGSPPCLNRGTTVMVRFASGAQGATLSLGPSTTTAYVPRYTGGTLTSAFVARAEPSTASNDDVFTMAVMTATAAGPNHLTLPTPPDKLTPADNATGVTTGTAFSWQSLADSDYIVDLSPSNGSNTDPEIMIVTAAAHAALPELSALGVALPSGQVAYNYNLVTVAPFASVDALVNTPGFWIKGQALSQGLFPHFYNGGNGPFATDVALPNLTITQSAPFTLTTPP